ncbi:alpha/beta hydrolase [Salinifilum aidingensis]
MPSCASTAGDMAGPTYRDSGHWRRYQEFFPTALRVPEGGAPDEEWWRGCAGRIHLDRVARPEARAKLLVLHGVGTYGRMLAPFGRLPGLSEYEFLAPDLPGFGLSRENRDRCCPASYTRWVECLRLLVRAERARDPRPVVLFGLSTGGRLAYDVAAAGADVAAVIATCLADARHPAVRRRLAAHPGYARWARALPFVPPPLDAVRVPMTWVANLAAVSNNSRFAQLVLADPLGGASGLPLRLARTCLGSAPVVPPEVYTGPPLLLACPDEDRWLPPAVSRAFLARMDVAPGGPTRYAPLRGAGHVPVEESGLADLDRAARDFLDEFEPG